MMPLRRLSRLCYLLARLAIQVGLRIMPDGPSRRELRAAIGAQVARARAVLAAGRRADARHTR
ncbi:MAG: hypothetical protein E7K72_11845 [Roseomonas mucosa]|nr:hypothetical protein [Roseomonas mucosa]